MFRDNLARKNKTDDTLKTTNYDIIRGAETNDLEEVKNALRENPDCINTQDGKTGKTALHYAGALGNVAIATELFRHKNLNPEIEDNFGDLPMKLALESRNRTLIDLFYKSLYPEDYYGDAPNIIPLNKPNLDDM